MKEDEKFVIHISIANMEFPLTIRRKDEGLCRKAAKEINRKLNLYKGKYADLSQEYYIAMVAFDFARMALQTDKNNDISPYTEEIARLTKDIQQFLNDEK